VKEVYKEISKCEIYGFDNPLALHRHHDKEKGVIRILCANCHYVIHGVKAGASNILNTDEKLLHAIKEAKMLTGDKELNHIIDHPLFETFLKTVDWARPPLTRRRYEKMHPHWQGFIGLFFHV
jgi:hypothetical protein